jgi:hypothetical protein
MFEFLAFFVLFGIFMLRARMLDWKSIFSSGWEEDIHMITFLLFSLISLAVLVLVILCRTGAERRLEKEYGGVYVTPTEFRAGISRDKVGAAKFSENVKCETDAD